MPEDQKTDLSGPTSEWTFHQALLALTGKGTDLRSKIAGVQWFQIAGGGSSGGNTTPDDSAGAGGEAAKSNDGKELKENASNRADPNVDLYYQAFARIYYQVNDNDGAKTAWEQSLQEVKTVVDNLLSQKSGMLDLGTLLEAETLIRSYEQWLSESGEDFRSWGNKLDSTESGFSGKAASVIQRRMAQNADRLEGLHDQLTLDRGVAVSQALKELRETIVQTITSLVNAYNAFWSKSLYLPNNMIVDYENRIYEFLTKDKGLVIGDQSTYKMNGKTPDEMISYITQSLSEFTANVNNVPIQGDLTTAAPWNAMNRAIFAAVDAELKSLDLAASTAMKTLEDKFNYTRSAIQKLEMPEAIPPRTDPNPPTGNPGGNGPGGDSGTNNPFGDSGGNGPGGDSGTNGPGGDSGTNNPFGDSGGNGPGGDSGTNNPFGDSGGKDPFGDPNSSTNGPGGGDGGGKFGNGTGGTQDGIAPPPFVPPGLPGGNSGTGGGNKDKETPPEFGLPGHDKTPLPALDGIGAGSDGAKTPGGTGFDPGIGIGSGGSSGAGGADFDSITKPEGFAPSGFGDGSTSRGGGSSPFGGSGTGGAGFGLGGGTPGQLPPVPPNMLQMNGPMGAGSAGMGGMPFMPGMMGGMGGMGGQGNGDRERERQTWLSEDEDVWGTDTDACRDVIGRPDEADYELDEQVVTGPVRPPRQPARTPAEQEQTAQEATASGQA
ncbi:hypothetical protein [Saccharopolyspora shandongensis]|uniref:hypothetical protein n=1 Tax=Saccharopolyspora shandongensis TaxID=418495 RepID=UPI0033C56A65